MELSFIWKRIQQDDLSAFEVLYQTYYPGLCSYARELLHDNFLAEETIQDLFLKIWESRNEIFSEGNSLKKYMYRLAHNQCIDILRKRNTKKGNSVVLLSSDAWTAISEKYGFDEQLVEQLETKDINRRLEKIIDKLPEQCREIFIKSRYKNLTNEEIAEEMGLSVNTVRTQLYRAVLKIKTELFIEAITIIFAKYFHSYLS